MTVTNKNIVLSSTALASGPQFASLVALGPKIIPLVVNKLTLSGDFFAVELCKHANQDELSSRLCAS